MRESIAGLLNHYFLPHPSNNFRAKAIHHPSLVFYILALLVIQSFYLFAKQVNGNILGYATDISAERVLQLVNLEREKAGLKPLSLSNELSVAAEKKGVDMFEKNYWAHISPTGTTPWEFILNSGYQYVYAGENLAKSFDRSDDVVQAWMKSPTHKANIMKPEYSEIGLAVKNGVLNGEETTLVVQEFGSRISPAKVAQINGETAIPKVQEKPPAVEVKEEPAVKPVFMINRKISFLIAEFMLVVLLIDSLFIWKHKTVRIQGHSLAHVMFLLALFGAMSATGMGAIL